MFRRPPGRATPAFVVLAIAVAAASLLSSTGRALADPPPVVVTVSYPNFDDLSSFQRNGSTAAIPNPVSFGGQNVLRLTNALSQGGSAFLTDAITLANDASFSTFFSFQITDPIGISDGDGQGADGIVFVVQTVANTAGGIGGGIGYQNLPSSVGVEFDTWNNGAQDGNNGNHIGIDLNGNMSSVVRQNIATRMNNGAVWFAWVDYNGTSDLLEVRLSQTNARPASPNITHTVDLVTVLGQADAFVGFTSGTGAAGGDHDIRSWTFINQYNPIATGTITLAHVGSDTNPVGAAHTVRATVTEEGVAASGSLVHFAVISGPNTGASGSAVTDGGGNATFSYTSNGTPGVDVIEASFTDQNGFDHSATVAKTWTNAPPVVTTTGPYTVVEGSALTVSGSAADPEGQAVTYAWDLDNDGSFETPGQTATFSAAAIDGPDTHTISLRACDTLGACGTATTVVTIVNVSPTADAGGPYDVNEGGTVAMTGTGSDPFAGDVLTYAWDLDNNGSFESPGAITTFDASALDGPDARTVRLRVCDDDGGCTTADATVEVHNVPPTADAGGPYDVNEGGSLLLSGSGVDAAADDVLSYAWDLDSNGSFETTGQTVSFSAAGRDGPDTQPVVLRVCDDDGGCTTANAVVVIHNVAPTADAGAAQTVFRNELVGLSGTWTDPAGALDDPYAWMWDLTGDGLVDASGAAAYGDVIAQTTSFATEGTYVLTFDVTDKDGASDHATVAIEVLNQAPSCLTATPSIATLWSPNHAWVPISIEGLTDAEGDALSVVITGITQDEAVDAQGTGNTAPDGRGVGTDTAEVRAERSGQGDGRVYHISFSVDDGHGGSCSGSVAVSVPHDQGPDGAAVDGGPLFDSTSS